MRLIRGKADGAQGPFGDPGLIPRSWNYCNRNTFSLQKQSRSRSNQSNGSTIGMCLVNTLTSSDHMPPAWMGLAGKSDGRGQLWVQLGGTQKERVGEDLWRTEISFIDSVLK